MTQFAPTSFLAPIGRIAVRAWRVYQNRRQTMKLFELSDHQLADIGLSRTDVHRALRLPLFADPTHTLEDWASQNRAVWRPTIDASERLTPIVQADPVEQPLPQIRLVA